MFLTGLRVLVEVGSLDEVSSPGQGLKPILVGGTIGMRYIVMVGYPPSDVTWVAPPRRRGQLAAQSKCL